MVKPNMTYELLEFPQLGLPNIHRVRILKIYDNPKLGRIVRFRYNWPFAITEDVLQSDFEQWIAEEAK